MFVRLSVAWSLSNIYAYFALVFLQISAPLFFQSDATSGGRHLVPTTGHCAGVHQNLGAADLDAVSRAVPALDLVGRAGKVLEWLLGLVGARNHDARVADSHNLDVNHAEKLFMARN